MLKLKRNLLSVALASATLLIAMGAQAQSANSADEKTEEAKKKQADDAVDLDGVQVHGIRSAIEKSIDLKQTETSIIEAISAEDIGKLPDSSIAESLARLPGLTAQRERGRASEINIRGFAGDFATTTLNGREQATTQDNRGVEFDQYPSELLSSVVVYKTPDARLVGQGLSGTVDLRTVRPLDYSERVMHVGARYEQNEIRHLKENGHRLSFAYIDQLVDGKLGLSIGFATMDSPQPGFQNEPWGYTGFRGDPNLQILGGSKFFKFNAGSKRDSVMATIQARPNDVWESTLDWMLSRQERTEVKSGVEFWTEWGGGTSVRPGWVQEGGTVVASTWDGVYPVIRMDSNPIDSYLDSIGFNNKFTLNEHWLLNTDISYSRARNNYRNVETTANIKDGTTWMSFALDPSEMFFNYEFGADLGDPNALVIRGVADWGGQGGYYKDFNVEDQIKAFRANLVRSFDEGWISSIDFGGNITKRHKYKTDYEARLCLVDCTGGMAEYVPFPGGNVIDFGVGGIDKLAVYDADAMVKAGTWNIFSSPLDWYWGKSWDVEETVTSLYFQANIDTDLGGLPLRGNAGVQYQHADQSGAGYIQASNGVTNVLGDVVSYGDKYGNFLPSMNLSLEMLPDFNLRFAAARQIMRPPMAWMRGGMNVNICVTCGSQPIWSGDGGNAALRPWLANAYDLSLEKYFTTREGNRGYAGLAYFYKDLVSYLWTQTVPFDFAGFPLPPADPGQTNYPATTLGQMTQPANGSNGTISGYEASLSMPLDLLWSGLNGFGVVASYSDTDSSIRMDGPDNPNSRPLPGLSKRVSNVSVYYERAGFAIRYNRRERSPFVGNVRNYEGSLVPEQINGEVVQDAQASYSFNGGTLDGLSLYLQVSNIGDEPFTRSLPAGPTTYWEYGRTTLVGFSYKF